ncbi:unnamed protein product [Echinostoma caproni]|uniref:G_PROTEIN_RECEP_F1_2 domain-containing protein n=1 Tax=Echinostoma caproni TaxID=27848 RepID=A0A183A6K3_9TREM|nr:unnamed protein product [Echinostoma caproni]
MSRYHKCWDSRSCMHTPTHTGSVTPQTDRVGLIIQLILFTIILVGNLSVIIALLSRNVKNQMRLFIINLAASGTKARIMISVAWLAAALCGIPSLILAEKVSETCRFNFKGVNVQTYMVAVALTVFILPACVIATCHVLMVVTIWRASKLQLTTPGSGQGERKSISSPGLNVDAGPKRSRLALVAPFTTVQLAEIHYFKNPRCPPNIRKKSIVLHIKYTRRKAASPRDVIKPSSSGHLFVAYDLLVDNGVPYPEHWLRKWHSKMAIMTVGNEKRLLLFANELGPFGETPQSQIIITNSVFQRVSAVGGQWHY